MLFNSIEFLIFFPIIVALYFLFPYKYRWMLLLTASIVFYMWWKIYYILLVLVSASVDYFAGLMMGQERNQVKRKKYLIISLAINIGILFVFKYFNFFNEQFRTLFQYFNLEYGLPKYKLLLPVGISFYTFQAMGYSIDVYRKAITPEKNFFIYFLYVMFFPQLVAGPIERAGHLLPQFYQTFVFNYKRVSDGLKLMLWGLFKKVVIADRLAVFVNQVYNKPTDFEGVSLLIATVFFAFQIYCDFSGYSDIGIGGAQVLGFKLMDNFKRPYFSKSISEFWKRWHISLSTWFKDYFYISLGGNRVSVPRWYFNLFITFLVSGFWHGANWTFLFWGALHGFYLICGIITAKPRASVNNFLALDRFPKIHKIIQVLFTFFLVCFAWIFFRANTASDAFYIVSHLFSGLGDFVTNFISTINVPNSGKLTPVLLGQKWEEFLIVVLFLGFMELVHLMQRHGSLRHMLSRQPIWLRWPIYYTLILSILFFGILTKTPFIYFQF